MMGRDHGLLFFKKFCSLFIAGRLDTIGRIIGKSLSLFE